ncbi:hypothetical protein BDV59DRAFT_137694 [Aspergillus ambiguus]|uniref:uncharacterized protein n=1 Tax=Aspergillus ambiguus TaxID=176160 RepID=UPI003CCD708A
MVRVHDKGGGHNPAHGHPALSSSTATHCTEEFALRRRISLLLHKCRIWEEGKQILASAGAIVNPVDVIQPHMVSGPCKDVEEAQDHDDRALDQMLKTMWQLLASKGAISELEMSERDIHISEPLLPHLRRFLSDDRSPAPFDLVYGMEMLLSTYKFFLGHVADKARQNCRILSLKFWGSEAKRRPYLEKFKMR